MRTSGSFSITVDLQDYISFRCTPQWLDIIKLSKWSSLLLHSQPWYSSLFQPTWSTHWVNVHWESPCSKGHARPSERRRILKSGGLLAQECMLSPWRSRSSLCAQRPVSLLCACFVHWGKQAPPCPSSKLEFYPEWRGLRKPFILPSCLSSPILFSLNTLFFVSLFASVLLFIFSFHKYVSDISIYSVQGIVLGAAVLRRHGRDIFDSGSLTVMT